MFRLLDWLAKRTELAGQPCETGLLSAQDLLASRTMPKLFVFVSYFFNFYLIPSLFRF